ncbi:nuclear transport factor 2 family protein [Terrimonas sp. NA20]|uniref:Nuclear transport factor 2 family protein n=1 Tax=Terrimonas ginsenosidimutans TaxID=2908004 RepID=A0ABS9KK67_9BACT|nr:nuclear transport factor 2 family protein [Terrimonas ginsenosidimutans]MCG2612717.1 nuclear transport factor 2 family protein [Terrimonas ginsenosidimutans]
MSTSNKELLLKGNAAIANGDHEGFLALCTDNTLWNFLGDQVLEGKQAVREYMAATYLEPPIVTVDHLISEGDLLTAVGEITLKDKTGKATHYSYCDVWRFEHGKMAELKAFVVEIKQ